MSHRRFFWARAVTFTSANFSIIPEKPGVYGVGREAGKQQKLQVYSLFIVICNTWWFIHTDFRISYNLFTQGTDKGEKRFYLRR